MRTTRRFACFVAAGLRAGRRPADDTVRVTRPAPIRHRRGPDWPHPQPRYLHQRPLVRGSAQRGATMPSACTTPTTSAWVSPCRSNGLNTIDARETTARHARKWVIGPHETIVIDGWQTSQRDARRFEFTTEVGSYGQALGRTANLGIISAAFFRERVAPPSLYSAALEPGIRTVRLRPPRCRPLKGRTPRPRKRSEKSATNTPPLRHRPAASITPSHRSWLDFEDTPAHTMDVRYRIPSAARAARHPGRGAGGGSATAPRARPRLRARLRARSLSPLGENEKGPAV